MIPTVTFKVKPYKIIRAGESEAVEAFDIPALTRKHCKNLHAWRCGQFEAAWMFNSDFFPGILRAVVAKRFGNGRIYLDRVPEGVKVSEGFLRTVEIEFPENPRA